MDVKSKICEAIQIKSKEKITKVICTYCNRETDLVWVHGHFQCKLCKYVVESCCEGGEINE